MNETSPCPQCGKPVTSQSMMGLCPECLLKAGFGTATGDGAALSACSESSVPPSPEELAARFPQLEIIELLGQGGMGAVYKARQKQLDRLVALKILPPAVSHDPSFAARFTREAKALAKLQHPNIVTLYEFGEAQGQFYFLMEYVDGLNLRQILNAGSMSPKEALAIVPQICDALQAAHDQGIVHRDIKPENILLNKTGQVKIADFGVAKLVAGEECGAGSLPAQAGSSHPNAQTEAGKVVGTAQYMAPEQIASPREVDHRADIYALGVVFYQMLTGELPVGKFEKPSQRVQVDVRLDEVVLRAMEKEPARRFQSVTAMKTAVESISITAPRRAEAGAKMQSEASKSNAWAWVTGVALAIGIPGGIALLLIVLMIVVPFILGLLLFAMILYGRLSFEAKPPPPTVVETAPPIVMDPEFDAPQPPGYPPGTKKVPQPPRYSPTINAPAIVAQLQLASVPLDFHPTPQNMTLDAFKKMPDIDLLSAPTLVISSGTSGKIEVTDQAVSRPNTHFVLPAGGIVAEVEPVLKGDTVSSNLNVSVTTKEDDEHSQIRLANLQTTSKLGELYVFDLGPTSAKRRVVGSVRFSRAPAEKVSSPNADGTQTTEPAPR